MAVGILTDSLFLEHDDPSHPEHAGRLRAIRQALAQSALGAQLVGLEPRPASDEQLRGVHHEAVLRAVEAASADGKHLDADTYTTQASAQAARLAAGAAVGAVEAVLEGEVTSAFALVRPPGHHATPGRSMGFCLYNNIAVAARAAISQFGLERVAIVDWDVHHGNGTQDCFWEDGSVLFCSTHAYGYGYYPGSGALGEVGDGAGYGATLNVPLPFGAGDQGLVAIYEEVIAPAVRAFQPQLLLVSAGYDAHWADPLGPLQLSVAGYARIASIVYNLAQECCGGRLVCTLEGGYNLQALAASVLATIQVLAGQGAEIHDPLGPAQGEERPVRDLIERVVRRHPLLTT